MILPALIAIGVFDVAALLWAWASWEAHQPYTVPCRQCLGYGWERGYVALCGPCAGYGFRKVFP